MAEAIDARDMERLAQQEQRVAAALDRAAGALTRELAISER
jgi:hypothetical protein